MHTSNKELNNRIGRKEGYQTHQQKAVTIRWKPTETQESNPMLLHPNPVFCQSSHECMSQPDHDIIWLNHGKSSNDSNISTLKELSIDKHAE
jgi:hypothetical protein